MAHKITDAPDPGCDQLYYGRACKNGHSSNGEWNLRFKKGGGCCKCRPGLSDLTDSKIAERFNLRGPKITKATKGKGDLTEERKKRRSEASMRWTRKNKDKHSEYQKKYQSKPEVKAKGRAANLAKYHALPIEEKQRLNKERYVRRKNGDVTVRHERTPEEQELFMEMKRLQRNARERERYNNRSPEEKKAIQEKHKFYMDAKKAREKKDE